MRRHGSAHSLIAGALAAGLVSSASLTPASVKAEVEMVMTDAAIAETVEDQLFMDPAVPSHRITATAQDGLVSLSGRVNNILAKERAEKIAETVKGVRAVVNTLAVHLAASREPEKLEQDVVTALASDPATDSWEINAQAMEQGLIKLTGTVQSWHERELAATVVKGVRGVTAVNNKIDVDVDPGRLDREIEAEITQALRWNAFIDHALIGVAVNNGQVSLTGTVASAAEKRLARMEAWTAGVEAVDASELVVAKWTRDPTLRQDKYGIKSEEAVRLALRDALEADPRVEGTNVEVSVTGGLATLRGQVKNLRAKRAAAEDARNTVGVVDVVNRLKVRPDIVPADATLEDRVEAALKRDPYVERFDIRVSTASGVVYLLGTVDGYFEQSRADVVAAGVAGVVDVVNNLVVRRGARPFSYNPYVGDPYIYDFSWYTYQPQKTFLRDEKIEEQIEAELWWSPFVDSDQVSVSVNDGVATLEGSVETWSEYSIARENAFEGGATWVLNDLSVSAPENES